MAETQCFSRSGRGTWRWSAVAAVILLLVTSCGDQGGPTGTVPDDPPASWPTLGLDLGNSRANLDESVIGPDNVADLEPIWEVEGIDGYTGTPIIDDGVLYGGDWAGNVWALDPETGETQWQQDIDGTRIQTAVALDDEKVFVGTFGGQFAALDRATGDIVWEIELDEHEFASAFSAPIYVDAGSDSGLVIVGVASYENMVVGGEEATFRGSVMALDSSSGDEVWRYWTTTGDEEEGAGVGVWTTPAVDLERGHLYFGTGQHYAEPTSDRSDAVIALDVATGEEQWVHQYTEGDAWTLPDGGLDLDVSTPPNLFEVDGTDAVGAGDKDGTYKALDRATGEELWSRDLTEGGPQGGLMHSAAVVDGTIFVASNEGGTNAALFALDADTGDEKWSSPLGGAVMGPVTWANGVVYTADNSGAVSGFDAADGAPLWSHVFGVQSGSGITVLDGTVYAGYGWWLSAPPDDPQGGLAAFRPGDGGGNGSGPGDDPDGAAIYQQRCATCHGGDGTGGSGPSLTDIDERLSEEEQLEIVRDGRGQMPAWEGILSDEEIEAVLDYMREELAD